MDRQDGLRWNAWINEWDGMATFGYILNCVRETLTGSGCDKKKALISMINYNETN